VKLAHAFGRLGRIPSSRSQRHGSPRLVLRFAVVTALALGVAAAAILFVVRGLVTSQAERSATDRARLVVDTVLAPTVRRRDLAGPVVGARRAAFDRVVQRALADGLQRVTIATGKGLVVYSTDHLLIGRHLSLPGARAVAGGSIISTVGTGTGGTREGKMLETLAPLPVATGVEPGVAIVEESYSTISAAAGSIFFPIAAVLEVILVALFVLLIPLLRRVSIRIDRQIEEIEHAAYFDDLTELPNRRHFLQLTADAIAAAGPTGRGPAVLLLDLDHFKDVNDTLGHQYGDVLLQALCPRLAGALGDAVTLARLGGDEFGILAPAASEAEAIALAERVLASLNEPIVVADIPLAVETGVGIALSPAHGVDADTLLRRADVAMYSAKKFHAGYVIYDPGADTHTADSLSLVAELRRALANRELSVVYQPKARLADAGVSGVEALVRWNHPTRGLVSPADFIPIAERTGLIRPLTRYVLDAAVRQARLWAEAGLYLNVAVNLSAADIVNSELPDEVAALLQREFLPAGLLGLEVTETAVMSDPASARDVLLRLRGMGIRLAIDDYGTGHSSLSYLKALPVTALKIDRSFVSDMASDRSDATIVRSTITLARSLGLDVVAEGVETAEAWEDLRAFGCTEAQGYLIARPLAAEELPRWLSAFRANGGPTSDLHTSRVAARALSVVGGTVASSA
jgi:diguanylate cyclase (GGDEF)-like protein